jgi:hypothetical protein
MDKTKLMDIIAYYLSEYDMDAVYLDQTAAHVPHACMDKTHSHAPGGGSWWSSEYRALLRALNPYLTRDRLSKLEKAMHAAKMAKFATIALDRAGAHPKNGR